MRMFRDLDDHVFYLQSDGSVTDHEDAEESEDTYESLTELNEISDLDEIDENEDVIESLPRIMSDAERYEIEAIVARISDRFAPSSAKVIETWEHILRSGVWDDRCEYSFEDLMTSYDMTSRETSELYRFIHQVDKPTNVNTLLRYHFASDFDRFPELLTDEESKRFAEDFPLGDNECWKACSDICTQAENLLAICDPHNNVRKPIVSGVIAACMIVCFG